LKHLVSHVEAVGPSRIICKDVAKVGVTGPLLETGFAQKRRSAVVAVAHSLIHEPIGFVK
jgi:hypothetical protein